MPHEIHKERLYPVPIEDVWSVISDHRSLHRWLVPGMKVRLDPEGVPAPNGLGAIRVIEGWGVRVREEVVEYAPPTRLCYTVLSGFPLDNHLGQIDLSTRDNQTHLSWRVTFEPHIPGTGWLMYRIVNATFGQGLARLGRLLAQ